jgi:hypothetical protein
LENTADCKGNEMTTQLSEHAKSILRALVDGKQIEYRTTGGWVHIPHEYVLSHLRDNLIDAPLRIAPETRTINGVTFPAPNESGTHSLLIGDLCYRWDSKSDRMAALLAIVDALEGRTK